MRILLTTDYYPPHFGGGVEVVIAEVGRRLIHMGHEVMVVALDSVKRPATTEYEGVVVRQIPSVRLNRLTGLELRVSLSVRSELMNAVEEFAPDLINAHHSYFTSTPAALRAARRLGVPAVLTLHVASMEEFDGWRGAVARLYEKTLSRRILAQADALVAVSDAVAGSVRRHTGREVTVIPNGVDVDRFFPESSRNQKGKRVVFVGRLIANKGPDKLLSAFRHVLDVVPTATLRMVGDGPMRRTLERYVQSNDLSESVEFLGLRRDIDRLLREADVLVRPSLVEGMPLAVLEAMSSGLPVIVSNVGGVKELVENEVSGIVVPPRSESALVGALVRLLNDEELRVKMGAAGRQRVVENFSWDRTASATESLFSGLVRAAA